MPHVTLLVQRSSIVKSKQEIIIGTNMANTQGTTSSSEIPQHEHLTYFEVTSSHHCSQNCYQSEHLYKGRKKKIKVKNRENMNFMKQNKITWRSIYFKRWLLTNLLILLLLMKCEAASLVRILTTHVPH